MISIRNLGELQQATERDPGVVEHYQSQVTVDKDLRQYLRWLNDNEITTHVDVKLKRNKGRSLGVHPSSACKDNVCLLKLYYDCTHEVPPSRKYVQESQMTWDIGTMLHCVLQTWFKQMYGDQFQDEVFYEDKPLHITSHTDGLFTFSRYRFVLEIKSIKEGGNYGFEKVQLRPMADNVRQAHFYMYLADVPFALLFYMCKNNSKWKEHPVVFDFNLWNRILDDTVRPVVNAAYHGGPMVAPSPGWSCKWCDYEHSCASAKSYKSKGEANAAQQARQWARSRW